MPHCTITKRDNCMHLHRIVLFWQRLSLSLSLSAAQMWHATLFRPQTESNTHPPFISNQACIYFFILNFVHLTHKQRRRRRKTLKNPIKSSKVTASFAWNNHTAPGSFASFLLHRSNIRPWKGTGSAISFTSSAWYINSIRHQKGFMSFVSCTNNVSLTHTHTYLSIYLSARARTHTPAPRPK